MSRAWSRLKTGCQFSSDVISRAERPRSFGGGQPTAVIAARSRRTLALCASVLFTATGSLAHAPRADAHPYRQAPRAGIRQRYQRFRWELSVGGNITQGTTSQYLNNGWTLEAGATWFPAAQSILGLRLDVNYSRFEATHEFIARRARLANTEIDSGIGRIWGGDADLVIDVPLGRRVQGYLFGGVGTYQRQVELSQTVLASGLFCDPWWGVCGLGFAPFDSVVSRTTTATHFAWNAGAGLEFPLNSTTSLFIEARFVRINPANERTELVPITVGLRF